MGNPTAQLSRRIARVASTLSDPRRVQDLILLLENPYFSASELPQDPTQDFSTRIKRLRRLEDTGLLTSWRNGPKRRYNAIRRKDLVNLLNEMISFSKGMPMRQG